MTTTTFTWDIASGLPVVLDDGNQYLYGAGLSAMKQGSAWSYYLADGLGSTMAVVDASGAVQKSYQYDVYGEVTGGSGSLANEFDFAGQQTDATGLQYLRARYYDPASGVFLSREPLAVAPGWTGNPFGYAGASPVTFTDPTGEQKCLPGVPCLPSCLWFACPKVKDFLGLFCDISPACIVVYGVTLESFHGQSFDLDITTTKKAAEMLKAEKWSAEEYRLVKEYGRTFTDSNGNKVWLVRHKNGLYDWLIEDKEGLLLSARKQQSQRTVDLARQSYKWK